MFDIGSFEILILILISLVILKPEDIPKAMHLFGKFIRKINYIAREFYNFFDNAVFDLEEEEKKAKNKEKLTDNSE